MPEPVSVLLLPGLDGTEVFLHPLVAQLSPAVRAITVVYPSDGPHTYEGPLQWVRRVTADLPRFYVFGSSFAGPLALMLASAEPRRVAGLILSATFLTAPRKRLKHFAFAATAPVIWSLRAARRLPVWAKLPSEHPFRIAKAQTWRRVRARALASRLRAIATVDVRPQLLAYERPILVMAYSRDRVVPHRSQEEILEIRPQARLAALPGDHFGHFYHAGRCAETILRFVRHCEMSGSPAARERALGESL